MNTGSTLAQPAFSIRNIVPVSVRVGFGTASLLGSQSHADAVRLLDAAMDAGIRYIDTARMYGSGNAEAVVGEVARRHRDRMILVTKAGILPPRMSIAARLARKLAAKAHLSEPAFARPPFHVFSPTAFGGSVETSLRTLGVDHIDLLLLHEASPEDITPDLLAVLDTLVQQGKIRGYGLATGADETLGITAAHPSLRAVAQFPNSVWDRNLDRVRAGSPIDLIGSHSIMGTRFSALMERLRSDQALRDRWSKALDFDVTDRPTLGRLFLTEALAANPEGVVLFSSSNRVNIAANVRIAADEGGPLHSRVGNLRKLTAV